MNEYQSVRFDREGDVLQVTLHTDGGPLVWGSVVHDELIPVIEEIGREESLKVVILTGAGDAFIPSRAAPPQRAYTPTRWEHAWRNGVTLLQRLLEIPVPVIAALNGPVHLHAEIPLLSNIVLAAPHATIQDSPHLAQDLVPGDGMHIVMPLLLSHIRAGYFLLVEQQLTAEEALAAGLINEIVDADELLDRAWEIARGLERYPMLNLRFTRTLLTQNLKRELHDLLGYGLALEGLAALDRFPAKMENSGAA